MISLEDCIGMCGVDADEVAAIGEHEHIPNIAAEQVDVCNTLIRLRAELKVTLERTTGKLMVYSPGYGEQRARLST